MKKLFIICVLTFFVNMAKAQKADTTKADYLVTSANFLRISTNYAVAGTAAFVGGYYLYREYFVYNADPGVSASGPVHILGGISMVVGGVLLTGAVLYRYQGLKYLKKAGSSKGGRDFTEGMGLFLKATPSSVGLALRFN